jgi:hypothetical protein
MAESLLDGSNKAKGCGIGILEELGKQRWKLGNISDNVRQLNTDLDRGESLLNEMQCRRRQRKYILVGVVVFLFVTLGVFIDSVRIASIDNRIPLKTRFSFHPR